IFRLIQDSLVERIDKAGSKDITLVLAWKEDQLDVHLQTDGKELPPDGELQSGLRRSERLDLLHGESRHETRPDGTVVLYVRGPHPRLPRGPAHASVGSGEDRARAQRLRAREPERVDGVHGTASRLDRARALVEAGGYGEGRHASEGRHAAGLRPRAGVGAPRSQSHAPAPRHPAGTRLSAHGEQPEV